MSDMPTNEQRVRSAALASGIREGEWDNVDKIPPYDFKTQSLITGRPRDLSEVGLGGRLSGFIRGFFEAQSNPDYQLTSWIGQKLFDALVGNRNETPDRSDVIVDDARRAPSGNMVRNETERSAVRAAFEGMASELGISGPEFWNLVSDANLEVRNGRASSALNIVAARLGVDEDTLIDKGLQHGFTMENGQIRVSDAALGRTAPTISRSKGPAIVTGDESFYDGSREGPAIVTGDESFYDGSREGPAIVTGDESFYDGSREPPVMGIHPDFADRHGNKLSSEAVEKLSGMEAELNTAGLLRKNQGNVIDEEPQGNRVNASGQEAAVVAQR